MNVRHRVARSLLIAVTTVGFAASTGTAFAAPSDNGLANRSDQAAQSHADHQPDGAGQGRKVG